MEEEKKQKKKQKEVNNSTQYCVNHKRLFTTPP